MLPLRAAGFEVIASDISDRGCPDCTVADFFDLVQLPADCDTLLTNPPFYCVEQFVRHALALRPRRLVLLLRLAFMEARRRTDILEGTGLARIHVFDRRLPMMHRASWTGKKANRHGVRLVRVGARLPRANDDRSDPMGPAISRNE